MTFKNVNTVTSKLYSKSSVHRVDLKKNSFNTIHGEFGAIERLKF